MVAINGDLHSIIIQRVSCGPLQNLHESGRSRGCVDFESYYEMYGVCTTMIQGSSVRIFASITMTIIYVNNLPLNLFVR